MSSVDHDAPARQLLGDLFTDVRTLVRQEIALARAEIREERRRLLVIGALLGAALSALALAGLWLLVALTRAIADIFNWPLWGVYAAVGVVLGAVALVLLLVVWNQLHKLRFPPKTRETLAGARRLGDRRPQSIA
jgi:uncharacterized membrane protein YqjE